MGIKAKVISKTASYGRQRWRINPNGSYSVLVFGTTAFNQTQHYFWIDVLKEKVPIDVKDVLK